MSSIRPLITISILGIVGLVLYMKINETEPVVPADAMNWDMSGDLDIGDLDIGGTGAIGQLEISDSAANPAGQVAAAPLATTTAPSYSAAPSFTAAPAFTADTKTAAPPAFVPDTTLPTADLAPAASPTAAKIEGEAAPISKSATTAPAAVTKSGESSKLPPLPALPAIAAGTAAVAKAALSDSAPATNPLPVKQELPTPTSTAPSYATPETLATTESLQGDAKTSAGQASLFSATRVAVQSALDRGELSQALLLLSDWYGDPSLSTLEATEVQDLLSQLAGSVIYSTEHRLEPPYMVKAGETLEDIALKHNVPWQLLAKINGLANSSALQPGQQLKVVRGPFSARIDLSERKMVLMLDRRYAGQFAVNVDPTSSIEEGYWAVNQKLLTPGSVGLLNSTATPSEDRSILLTSTSVGANQVTILRGPSTATDSAGRVIQLQGTDVADVYDILSLGSQVVIRR